MFSADIYIWLRVYIARVSLSNLVEFHIYIARRLGRRERARLMLSKQTMLHAPTDEDSMFARRKIPGANV